MKIGKKYEITISGNGCGKRKRKFKGKCIDKKKRFYILESTNGYKECFLKSDFTTGESVVKEV